MKYIIIALAVLLLIYLVPIKISKKVENETFNNNKILCGPNVIPTDPIWTIMDGSYKNIIVKGNLPHKQINGRLLFDGANNFILYGRFAKIEEKINIKGFESTDIFIVEDWDIAYPINRDYTGNWISPKYYLTIIDFFKNKNERYH